MAALKKKVALITNTSTFFLSHRLPLANGAKARGYEVYSIAPYSLDESERIQALGFPFRPIEMGRKSMNPFYEMKTIYDIYRQLKAIKPDIVHTFTIKPVLYGTLVAHLLDIPKIIVTFTGLGYLFTAEGLKGRLFRWVAGFAFKLILSPRVNVIFQNHDDREMFLKNGWVSESQSRVIAGTGVDLDRFKEFSEPPLPVRILFPARYLKDKGIQELLEAGKILSDKGYLFKIVLCGKLDDGNPSSMTAEELLQWKSYDFVEEAGYQKQMEAAFRNCHIVCLPSYREGIPLALMEACGCGRPIVTCDVPGCRSVVEDHRNGYLVPVKNPTALADKLAILINDKVLREQMGHSSRQKATAEFSHIKVVKENLDVY